VCQILNLFDGKPGQFGNIDQGKISFQHFGKRNKLNLTRLSVIFPEKNELNLEKIFPGRGRYKPAHS